MDKERPPKRAAALTKRVIKEISVPKRHGSKSKTGGKTKKAESEVKKGKRKAVSDELEEEMRVVEEQKEQEEEEQDEVVVRSSNIGILNVERKTEAGPSQPKPKRQRTAKVVVEPSEKENDKPILPEPLLPSVKKAAKTRTKPQVPKPQKSAEAENPTVDALKAELEIVEAELNEAKEEERRLKIAIKREKKLLAEDRAKLGLD